MDYIVKNLWGRILRGSHGKLGDMFKLKARTIIYKFNLCYFHLVSLLILDEDILGFQVRMYNLALTQEQQ